MGHLHQVGPELLHGSGSPGECFGPPALCGRGHLGADVNLGQNRHAELLSLLADRRQALQGLGFVDATDLDVDAYRIATDRQARLDAVQQPRPAVAVVESRRPAHADDQADVGADAVGIALGLSPTQQYGVHPDGAAHVEQGTRVLRALEAPHGHHDVEGEDDRAATTVDEPLQAPRLASIQ